MLKSQPAPFWRMVRPYVVLLLTTGVLFGKLNSHRQDRKQGNITRRLKLSFTLPLYLNGGAHRKKFAYPIPGFLIHSACTRTDLPNFKSTYSEPHPLASNSIHKASTNAFKRPPTPAFPSSAARFLLHHPSVQREQGALSMGRLWTRFVDSAVLRWLGRSLRCNSSPLEDIFEDAKGCTDDA
jgi:hypothetical protein